MRTSFTLLSGLAVLAFAGTSAGWAQSGGHTVVEADQLEWQDVPALPPGAKGAIVEGPLDQAVPFTLRLRLPANYEVPAHSHPAIEHATVLSGTVNMGFGEELDRSATSPLPTGAIAIMEPNTNHFVWTGEASGPGT